MRLGFGNAFAQSTRRRVEQTEERVEESGPRGLWTVGVCIFRLLAQEDAKGKDKHKQRRTDMCGDPWKDGG